MNYESLIKTADEFATKAHEGQTDRQGVPYIQHPRAVASFVDDPKLKVVALLHDVLEDTDTQESTVREIFGDEVTDLLLLLSRDKSTPYRDYVINLSKNEEAKTIKLADLRHNMDLTRYQMITSQAVDFLTQRYIPAYNFLKNGGNY